MSIRQKVWNWNGTEEEWRASYPCDQYAEGPHCNMMRAVAVQAPAGMMYRWLCQLTIAPYSYDWLDNHFRRSPRRLTPGADRLEGRRLLLFPITEFERNVHITAAPDPQAEPAFGVLGVTYAVRSTGPDSCRLVVKLVLRCRTRLERLAAEVLAWGDLIMMRKQLSTLKRLAERDARDGVMGLRAGTEQ